VRWHGGACGAIAPALNFLWLLSLLQGKESNKTKPGKKVEKDSSTLLTEKQLNNIIKAIYHFHNPLPSNACLFKRIFMKIHSTAFFLLISITCLHAQEAYTFKHALFANIPHRYGREALYTDALAFQLYQKNLRQPAEGVAFADGDTTAWQQITADSAGRLIRRRTGRAPASACRADIFIFLTILIVHVRRC
jgi:hypothetical protein